MKRTGQLFDRVASFPELCAAAQRAAKGKRISLDAAAFLFDVETEVLQLQRELLDGTYRPGAFRTFRISDPKPRTISAAPFRDRVVHHALCAAMEPTFEQYAIHHTYACRPGKGTLAAVLHAQRMTRRSAWFLKLDVEHFFETVAHQPLKDALGRKFKDPRVLHLCEIILGSGAPGSEPGRGLPIGNLTSQHFANFYLGAFDHQLIEHEGLDGYCRFMDDVLAFVPTRERALALASTCDSYLRERLQLRLKHAVTLVQATQEGVPFLGFRIWPGTIRFDAFRARRFRRRFRVLHGRMGAGMEDEDACERSAASLVGWARQANTLGFRRSFFARLGGCGMAADGERRTRARTG